MLTVLAIHISHIFLNLTRALIYNEMEKIQEATQICTSWGNIFQSSIKLHSKALQETKYLQTPLPYLDFFLNQKKFST